MKINDLINRFKSWQSTVPGIAKIILGLLVALKIIEISDQETLLDSVDQVFVGILSILYAISGVMDVWKKDKV